MVALLTDFGYSDYYVAALKGVIKSESRDVEVVDVTHGIPHFSVWDGSFVLYHAFKFFPEETVFLVVVDPGVGTSRRILVVKMDGKYLVGPDNGIFYPLIREKRPELLAAVDKRAFESSHTFQGRDIMAKVAARLALGRSVPMSPVKHVHKLNGWSTERTCGQRCSGRVIYVDTYGNLITNIRSDAFKLRGPLLVVLGGKPYEASYSTNYAKQGVLVVPGGYGLIEISVGRGNASAQLNAGVGSVVSIEKIQERHDNR